MATILHDQKDEFDERNAFLHVALGAIALFQRLDRIVTRYVPETAERPVPRSREDELSILFVLGLLSLRARIMDLLRSATETWRPAAAPLTDAPAEEGAPSWLR